jgi:hypothetical protein
MINKLLRITTTALVLGIILASAFIQINTIVWGQEGVKIGFRVSPLLGVAPVNAIFDIEVGPPSSSECAQEFYVLDFGDGSRTVSGTAAGPTQVSHTYSESGDFLATLSFTREENIGIRTPDCEQQSDSVSVLLTAEEREPIRYLGADSNWFNAENWSTGQVPGPNDDVAIEGDYRVVIDPELDPRAEHNAKARLIIDTISLSENAVLETRPGMEMYFETLALQDNAGLHAMSSLFSGEFVSFANSSEWPWFNPSQLQSDIVEFVDGHAHFSLGGDIPAGVDEVGQGHYANIRGNTISLIDVTLEVSTIYDFEPQVGDEFIIVEAIESLSGTFSNFVDGDEVARYGDISLSISYTDTQIVLRADSI